MKIPHRKKELERFYQKHFPEEPNAKESSLQLSDDAVIKLCRGASNSSKFDALFERGDTSFYDADDSRADLALVSMLAFYTQDEAQLERIFSDSALGQRQKWTQRADYRRRTIEKALRGLLETYTPLSKNGHQKNKEHITGDVGVLFSNVAPERVGWLWHSRIPRGKLTLVDGDPGTGKSSATTDLAARVSTGKAWPDGSKCEAGGVVIMSAEDGLADTIRPRLDAAGADPGRVLSLATISEDGYDRLPSVPDDLDIIRRGVERVSASLVVIDPLMAFLSGDVNSHKDQDVRRALAPLARLAEDTGAAIVVVRHLNKASGGNPIYRGGGSIGIIGAARSGLLVAKDPEDERRRVLASIKSNLAPPAPSLAFVLTEADNGAVRVDWKGESSLDAAALLSAPVDQEEKSVLDEAMEFLRDALVRGPVWSVQVKKDARNAEVSEATLRRAKTMLKVRSTKEADGSWSWSLPDAQGVHFEHEGSQASQDEHLEHLEHLPIDKPNLRGQQEQGVQHAQGAQHTQGSKNGNNRPLTEEEVQQARALIREGMAPHMARAEILKNAEEGS